MECECGKMWTGITPNTDTFYAMIIFDFPHFLIEIFGKGRAVSDFAATVLDTEEEWSGFCLEK